MVIFTFSTLINILRFFEVTTELDDDGNVIRAMPTALRASWVYVLFRHIGCVVFETIFPLVSLIFMNIKIYFALKRRNRFLPRLNVNQVREIAVTKVLVTIVLFYGLCHSLKSFFIVFEFITFLTGKAFKKVNI